MKLLISKKITGKIKEFNDREWKFADKEHYGQVLDWSKKNYLITAYDDNRNIVGTLAQKISVGVAHIDTLLVAKDMQGKGIGTSLLKKAEEIAIAENAHKIYLETGKNWRSIKFYEKLGYKISGKLPNHYFHVDFVEFTKFLEKTI